MRNKKYSNMSIPTALVNAVRKVVNSPDSVYTSMSDFIKQALRKELQYYQSVLDSNNKPNNP